jgi:hypothetical protein
MTEIRQIVQQAFKTNDLTIEAEEQLRLLLQTTRYSQEDINDFLRLRGGKFSPRSDCLRARQTLGSE